MEKDAKQGNIEKFMRLDPEKRNRILNAAMKEFRYGYKKATTDLIVREAGISKGLLFHYFGTKAQLFYFLMQYAADLVQRDYHDMLNRNNRDILEASWQRALLKRDLTSQHPFLYDFLNGAYAHWEDIPDAEAMASLAKEQQDFYEAFYTQCNMELFREDIDHKKAVDIIMYTLDGVFEDEENHEGFLETLRGYVDVFRQCFYKGEEIS